MLMRRIRYGLLALAVVAAVPPALAQPFGPAERRTVLDEVAAMTAAEREHFLADSVPRWVSTLRGQMPQTIDEFTTATGIAFNPPVIEFTYRTDARISFAADLMAERQAVLAEAICGQQDMFLFLAMGVSFRFVYLVGKAEMGTLTVVLPDCTVPAAAQK